MSIQRSVCHARLRHLSERRLCGDRCERARRSKGRRQRDTESADDIADVLEVGAKLKAPLRLDIERQISASWTPQEQLRAQRSAREWTCVRLLAHQEKQLRD